MRVLTWNIWLDAGRRCPDKPGKRYDLVLAELRAADADIACLQECSEATLQQLATDLELEPLYPAGLPWKCLRICSTLILSLLAEEAPSYLPQLAQTATAVPGILARSVAS